MADKRPGDGNVVVYREDPRWRRAQLEYMRPKGSLTATERRDVRERAARVMYEVEMEYERG